MLNSVKVGRDFNAKRNYHPINYGMPMPEMNAEEDYVYLVDFSFQPIEQMVKLAEDFGDRLTWIDHHQTSVDMEGEDERLARIKGVRHVCRNDEPISGCELAWKFYFSPKVPDVLKLIGDWDTWRYTKYNEARQKKVHCFQYGLKMIETDPWFEDGRDWWDSVLCSEYGYNEVGNALDAGEILWKYQRIEWRKTMKSKCFEATLANPDGSPLRVIAVNQTGSSKMFDGFYDPEKHDAMVTFQMTKDGYLSVSLYADKPEIHVGRLAKKLGEAGDMPSGGGHAGAAGFQCSWGYLQELLIRV